LSQKQTWLTVVSLALLLLLALACGGSGAQLAGTGIQGTSTGPTPIDELSLSKTIAVSGPLRSKNTINVAGIDFSTNVSTAITFNGSDSSTAALRTGMWLSITGTYNSNTQTGIAEQISYEADITGVLSSNSASNLIIDDTLISIDHDTFFDEGLSEQELQVGLSLIASGVSDGKGGLSASYVALNDEQLDIDYEEPVPDYDAQDDFDVFILTGTIATMVTGESFEIDGYVIEFDENTSVYPGDIDEIQVGREVTVFAEWQRENRWRAFEIVLESEFIYEAYETFETSGALQSIDVSSETVTLDGSIYHWDDFTYFLDLSEGEDNGETIAEDWSSLKLGDELYLEYYFQGETPTLVMTERLFTNEEVVLVGRFIEAEGQFFFESSESYRLYQFSNVTIQADSIGDFKEVIGTIKPEFFDHDYDVEVWFIEVSEITDLMDE
jgi:hypothetical protein